MELNPAKIQHQQKWYQNDNEQFMRQQILLATYCQSSFISMKNTGGGGVFITFLGRNWWIATQAIYQVSLFAVIHLDPGWIEVLWEQNTLHVDLAKCTNLAHSNLSLVNQLTDH